MDENEATSRDGTTIAYERSGQGPVVILVGGAFDTRSEPRLVGLADALASQLTVFNYDRRGRGDSGDTPPYAVEREVEDIAALVDTAGGTAHLYGWSSGSVLALEAASRLPGKVVKLAMYEPPFIVEDSRLPFPADYVERLNEQIAAGRRGDAVELFITAAFAPPTEVLSMMRKDPTWTAWEKVAHSLVYDAAVLGDTQSGRPLPAGRWASATAPTLVVTGELSPPFFHHGAAALVDVLPHPTHRVLAGQDHSVDPVALAPVLLDFLGSS